MDEPVGIPEGGDIRRLVLIVVGTVLVFLVGLGLIVELRRGPSPMSPDEAPQRGPTARARYQDQADSLADACPSVEAVADSLRVTTTNPDDPDDSCRAAVWATMAELGFDDADLDEARQDGEALQRGEHRLRVVDSPDGLRLTVEGS